MLFYYRKQNLYYRNGLIRKFATYLLSGKTGKGKTRLMSQIARDCKNPRTIVVSNYYNAYTDVFYSSFADFCNLQRDIAILGLHQNFDIAKKKEISSRFPKYFDIDPESQKVLKKVKEKYEFLTLGDEFYAYLFNRNFMANFAKGEGKQLLIDLHQTRHSNQTLILASQSADSLDHDTRELAHNEIDVKSWLLDLVYGFDVQRYLSKYDRKTMGVEFAKVNKFPYLFFNFYQMSKSIDSYSLGFKNAIGKIHIGKYYFPNSWVRTEWKLFESYILDYESNFNVRTDISVYKKGDLFVFLANREKKDLTR